MSVDAWVVSLPAAAANGDVQQCYPAGIGTNVAKSAATAGQWVRSPMQGALHAFSVQPDGAQAGVLELYDIDGNDAGANVSTATAITDTQLDALIASGTAKLIYKQTIPSSVGNQIVSPPGIYIAFMRGLGARYVSSGTCVVSFRITGGSRRYQWA
jgi:hypothetical protein